MVRVLIALLVVALSGSAWARRALVDDVDEFVAYAEVDSIERVDKRARLWLLYDYKTKHTYLRWAYWSQRTLAEFDCQDRRTQTLYYSYHAGRMGGGELIVGGPLPPGLWSSVSSGSLLEKFFDVACAR